MLCLHGITGTPFEIRPLAEALGRAGSVEQIVRSFAEEERVKLGKIAQPLRASLTGRAASPGVFDVMETLGRDETLARLQDVAEHRAGSAQA